MACSVVLYRLRLCAVVCFGLFSLVVSSSANAGSFYFLTYDAAFAQCNSYDMLDGTAGSGKYICSVSSQTYMTGKNSNTTQNWYYVVDSCPSNIPYDQDGKCVANEPAPSCGTDTIAGGPVNGGWGTGIYDVQGCAYSCGTNYSKLDGQTSMYDAQECTGLGQAYTTDQASDYTDPPAACEVKGADGSCLDMAQQPGGSCPTGTTYGQVNGTDVCVKSGDSTAGLDTGTAGKTDKGGDKPADLGTGEGTSDGTNSGGTTAGGTGTGTGTSESTSQCTSSTGADGTVTQTCTTSGTSQQETDYGTVDTPAIGENQFYKPLDKTADSVLQKFAQDVQATPIVSSVTGFFDVQLSGSCPTWTIPGVWVFDPMPIDMQCSAAMENVWPLIAAVLLATCAFFAFRIAFL